MSAPKPKSAPSWLLLPAVLAMLFGVWQLRKCNVYHSEVRSRPWAYSSDPAAKLLIGTWQGEFKDPAGVEKQVALEIFVPLTEEELEDKVTPIPRRRRVRSQDRRSFDGIASIRSKLGTESYVISGAVEKTDHHRISLDFAPEGDSKRVLPNYTARAITEGTWESDTMTVQLNFTRHSADGTSQSSSEGVVENGQLVWKENPDEKPVRVALTRK